MLGALFHGLTVLLTVQGQVQQGLLHAKLTLWNTCSRTNIPLLPLYSVAHVKQVRMGRVHVQSRFYSTDARHYQHTVYHVDFF